MADLATLQLEIDSRKAVEAKKALDDLAQSADKAEGATESLTQANREGEDRYKAIARAALERKAALDAEVRSQMTAGEAGRAVTVAQREQAREYTRVASAERQATLANERQAAAQRAAAEAAEKNRAALSTLLNQIDPLQAKLNRLDDMERQLTATFRQGGVDANTYAVALAKINGQRKDIGDQQMRLVASGAKEAASSMERLGLNTRAAQYDLMMLGRAAATGDLRQASSSMLQLGTRTNIAGAAARAALNPFTLLAAAIGGVYLLYDRQASQIRAYNTALIESGNAAGQTGEQLAAMAKRVGEQAGGYGLAREALMGLISVGKAGAADLEGVTRSITSYAVATGRSVADLVSEYQTLARDPAQGLLDLNEKHGYLTQAVYQHVKALQDQGRETDAVSAAMRAHGEMMDERAPQIAANLNIIQKAWRGAKSAASEYFAVAAQGIHHALGGARSSGEIRAELEGLLQERDREALGAGDGAIKWVQRNIFGKEGAELADPAALAFMDGQISKLYKELDTALQRESAALVAGDQARARELGLKGESVLDGLVDRSKTDLAKAREVARIRKAAEDAVLGYENDPRISQGQREAGIKSVLEKERIALAEIEKRFKPQGGRGGADISGYRRALQALTDDFRNANQILESERRANLIDEESYWQKKIDLIDDNERAQTAAMQAELGRLAGVKNSSKQIADIEAQMAKISKDAAKDRIVALNNQEAAQTKVRLAVQSYIDALNELVKAEERAGQQRLVGMGMGPRERELQAALSAADSKFAQEQVRLSRDSSKMGAGEYQQKLAGLVAEHDKMREAIVSNYRAIKEADGSWLLGAAEGARAYADEAANVYQSLGRTVSSAFKGMEDGIVEFAMTGKASFSDLADSIIRDMMRIMIQQSMLGPLSGALGSAIGGLFGGNQLQGIATVPFATGGYTGPGGKYEPAGIVHRGEYVLNQDATRRIGVSTLDRLNRGYAAGGLVGGPSVPAMAGGAPQPMKLEIINQSGIPVKASDGGMRMDVDGYVQTVILKDLRDGGPISQAMRGGQLRRSM